MKQIDDSKKYEQMLKLKYKTNQQLMISIYAY